MIKLFAVGAGRFLPPVQEILPTTSVHELYGVVSEVTGGRHGGQLVLLAPDGHQLQPQDTIAAYGAGTDERPIFVFFKDRDQNQLASTHWDNMLHSSKLKEIAHKLDQISSHPSTDTLQRQLRLAESMSHDGHKLSASIHQLTMETQLQRAGWQSALTNTLSILRAFQKHYRSLSRSWSTHTDNRSSYQSLLTSFKTQVEVLKRIPITAALGQSVFTSTHTTLYEWICAQDDHSSLSQLITECHDGLRQMDDEVLVQLLDTAGLLVDSAERTVQQCQLKSGESDGVTQENVVDKSSKLVTDLTAICESIQGTVRRVLVSGDAGLLSDITVSNSKLLRLMQQTHHQLHSLTQQLQSTKQSQCSQIGSGLRMLTELQQQLAETDSKLLLHYEHLQLTRRRFEILEQICAAPLVLGQVVNEIVTRKRFKQLFTEEAQRTGGLFHQLREREKVRRQRFLESCGQHFILSLFPSLTDKPPRFPTSSPGQFDEELCSIADDELESMMKSLQEENTNLQESENVVLWKAHVATQTAHTSSSESRTCAALLTSVGCQTMVEKEQELMRGRQDLVHERDELHKQLQQSHKRINQVEMMSKREQTQIKKMCEQLQQELEKTRSQLAMATSQHNELVTERDEARSQLAAVTSQHNEARSQLAMVTSQHNKAWSQLVTERDEARSQLAAVTSQHNEAQSQLAMVTSQHNKARSQLVTERDEARSQLATVTSQHNEARSQLAMVTSQHNKAWSQLVTERDEVRSQLAAVTSQHNEARSQLAAITSQRDEAQSQLAAVTSQRDETQVKLATDTTQVQSQLEIVTSQYDKVRLELETANNQRDEALSQLEIVTSQCDKVQSQLDTANNKHDEALSQLATVTSQCDKVQSQLDTANNQRDEALSQLATVTSQCDKVRSQLETVTNQHDEAQSQLVTAINDRDEAWTKLATATSQCDEAVTKKQEWEEKTRKIEERIEQLLQENQELKEKMEDKETDVTKLRGDKLALEADGARLCHELSEARREREELKASLESERDNHMKQSMELERELKEVQHLQENSMMASTLQLTTSTASTTGDEQRHEIKLDNLNVGDVALFIQDNHLNMLAVTTDHRIYYLDHMCAEQLADISSNVYLHLKRKIVIGRITEKVLLEVRKEVNRLKVPVGQRLYKITAVTVP